MEQLSDKQISEICMHMRVIDLMNSNPDIVDQSPEMKETIEKISANVAKMLDLLTEEQRDQVLEEHKKQLEAMKKKGKYTKAKH